MNRWIDILRPLEGPASEPGELEKFLEGRGASEEEIEWLSRTMLAPISEEEADYGAIIGVDAREWKMPTYPLPPSYLDLMRCYNGADGGGGQRDIQCFGLEEVRGYMLSYCVPHWLPLAAPFAFDGGGTFYAFDMRLPPDENGEFPIVMCHAGNLSWERGGCRKVADTLEQCFREAMEPEDEEE